ncbi:MAG TPA: autotransporter assembly complex family protein [Burkholderiaceae bacterium]|nr:autotransporter assembly complex family protein [Burkholderiaceae bacterium]
MGANPAQAQPAAVSPRPFAFTVQIKAPQAVHDYLQRHLDLQRYREVTDLDKQELARLLTAAERNARELLGTLGYFSPEIRIAPRDTPESTASARDVLITVDPGMPTRIGAVEIAFSGPIASDSAAAAQRAAIQNDWQLRPGQPFTQAAWEDAKAGALRALTARRYPTGELALSRADIDPDTRTANLSLTLASGPAYRFGPLQIDGMKRYDPELVERLARFPSGDEYDQARMLEAQQRLADSGYFDSVFVTLDTQGDPQAAPLVVQLREATLQKLVLGVGISTDGGPRLSVEHTHRKLPLLGWRALTKLSLDRATQSASTELTAPPDADNWRWIASGLLQRQDSGSFKVTSQRLRGGRSWTTERLDRSYYLQYDRAHTAGDGVAETADAVSANYAWTERHFDSLLFPASGHGLAVELGGGITLGSSREPYGRVLARWLGYRPFGEVRADSGAIRKSRLALRAEGGAVVARDRAQIPDTQLFVTGGDSTVRGYGYRDIGTQLPGDKVTAGRYLAVGSVEWQRPFVHNGRFTDWESTLFIDAGAVADKPRNLRAKVGIGAGARWRSPVGPLQVDLAYGVQEKSLRLHLSVGFTF